MAIAHTIDVPPGLRLVFGRSGRQRPLPALQLVASDQPRPRDWSESLQSVGLNAPCILESQAISRLKRNGGLCQIVLLKPPYLHQNSDHRVATMKTVNGRCVIWHKKCNVFWALRSCYARSTLLTFYKRPIGQSPGCRGLHEYKNVRTSRTCFMLLYHPPPSSRRTFVGLQSHKLFRRRRWLRGVW